MELSHLAIQIVIAIVCATLANVIIPRRIPGKFLGLILIGLAGVWCGEWGFALLRREYGIDHQILRWQIEGVLIVPAILGSAVILYIITAFIKWGKYGV